MMGTVSSASLCLAKVTSVAAPVRSCARFEVFHGGLLQCTMEMAEWPMSSPRIGCAWDSNLHAGPMHSSPFSGRVAHCAPPLRLLTKDWKDLSATTRTSQALQAGVRRGGRALKKPTGPSNEDTPLRHQIGPRQPPPHPCLPVQSPCIIDRI